jgi:hypothetical protein
MPRTRNYYSTAVCERQQQVNVICAAAHGPMLSLFLLTKFNPYIQHPKEREAQEGIFKCKQKKVGFSNQCGRFVRMTIRNDVGWSSIYA